jgi:phosphoglycerate dehydrogenase-like enzyme
MVENPAERLKAILPQLRYEDIELLATFAEALQSGELREHENLIALMRLRRLQQAQQQQQQQQWQEWSRQEQQQQQQ